jgi:hypothetical protein
MSLAVYAYSFVWPMSDVGQLVVFFVTNVWTFLLRKLLVLPEAPRAKSHVYSHSHSCRVLQTTTETGFVSQIRILFVICSRDSLSAPELLPGLPTVRTN